jgi:Tol biopolymer transport system component
MKMAVEMRKAMVRVSVAVSMVACAISAPAVAREVMLMNRIGPAKISLHVANADGTGERRLLPDSTGLDYDASFTPDGKWIVFTSERDAAGSGQADLWRVRPDGTGLERLTKDPSVEDAAAVSPDGKSMAYVSTKGGARTANIWVMDLATRRARNLTGDGKTEPSATMNGYFRPSWSTDGKWIAFSSDRGERWIGAETGAGAGHSHPTSIYVLRADGTGMRRLTTTTPQTSFGTPKWSADGRKLVTYEVPTRETFGARMHGFGIAALGATSQIVEIDVESGERKVLTSGAGLKTNPEYLAGNRIGYLVKNSGTDGKPEKGVVYSDGATGPRGDVRTPSWSPDGKSVVYSRFDTRNRAHWTSLYSWDKSREYRYTDVFPTVCPKSQKLAQTDLDFPYGNPTAAVTVMNIDGSNRKKIFQRTDAASLMPTWSPDCEWLAVGVGTFFGGRGFAPANVFVMKADGSESRQLTQSKVNAGYPAWHPDGRTLIYRVWGTEDVPEKRGLRAMDMKEGTHKVLTTGWDNFPFISPSGDRVVFTRRMANFDFEVFTMKPDGTDVKQLTTTAGADAHATWSNDGKEIWFSSSRSGFKDEAAMFDISPQPYAQVYLMKRDGTKVRQMTDSKWEDSMGTYVRAP